MRRFDNVTFNQRVIIMRAGHNAILCRVPRQPSEEVSPAGLVRPITQTGALGYGITTAVGEGDKIPCAGEKEDFRSIRSGQNIVFNRGQGVSLMRDDDTGEELWMIPSAAVFAWW